MLKIVIKPSFGTIIANWTWHRGGAQNLFINQNF